MAGSPSATYPLVLTQVADNTVVRYLNVLRGEQDELLTELGSVEDEGEQAGRRGTIRIESLHQGAGQLVARNPFMCEAALRIQLDIAGLLRWLPEPSETDLGAVVGGSADSMGAYTGAENESDIIVLPLEIVDSAGTQLHTPTAGLTRFSGSFAKFGDRIFFGTEETADRDAQLYAVYDIVNDTWADSTSPVGSHFITIGARMFRVVTNYAQRRALVSWTDVTGSNEPTFSTQYVLPLGDAMVLDVGRIGPHLLIAVGGGTEPGRIVTMDTEGNFTDIVPDGLGLSQPVKYIPYLNGALFLLSGSPKAIWFRSLTDVQIIHLGNYAFDANTAVIPEASRTGGPAAIAATSLGEFLFIGMDNCDHRGFNLPAATVFMLHPIEGGNIHGADWASSVVDWKQQAAFAPPIHVHAMRARFVSGQLQLQWVVHDTDDDHHYRRTINLWRGTIPPSGTINSQTPLLYTSRYTGGINIVKKFTRVRGFVQGIGSIIIGTYLDGSAINTDSQAASAPASAGGPISIDLPNDIVGRDVSLLLRCDLGDVPSPFTVEFPLEIDYISFSDQKSILRVPVVAGARHIMDSGAVEYVSKKDMEEDLLSLVDDPEPWTLSWYDGRSDWTVMPFKLEGREVEPGIHPATEKAVYWLSLQRI